MNQTCKAEGSPAMTKVNDAKKRADKIAADKIAADNLPSQPTVTSGAPSAPVTSGAPSAPVTSGAPSSPVTSGAPSAPVTSGAPSSPVTSGAPSAPVTSGTPSAPVTSGAPSSPPSQEDTKVDESIRAASLRYAQDTAKQGEEWINIAQAVKSSRDLHDSILKRLLASSMDQHKVFMTVAYLRHLMSRQNADFSAGIRTIDDEYDSTTFTDAQMAMLRDHLSDVYMIDSNAQIERMFVFKYIKYVNLMNKCRLVANKTSNNNMCIIIDQLTKVTFSADGKVCAPLAHTGKVYAMHVLSLLQKHWLIVLAVCLIVPAYAPVVVAMVKRVIALCVVVKQIE
jgi:hypothetical protein